MLEFVPLLQIQRELYTLPRGRERFQSYLRALINRDTGDLDLPLVAMNPMAKGHAATLLDQWISINAEDVAQQEVATLAAELRAMANPFRLGLVLADDLHGAWTNRYTTEFDHRFRSRALYKRGWIVALLWTSEPPSLVSLRDEIRTAAYRAEWIQSRGIARSLRQMLAQEGAVMARAGCTEPRLDDDDIAYTEEVLDGYLNSTHHPEIIAALFGDRAARELGYDPLGLSERAGLAWALHCARRVP